MAVKVLAAERIADAEELRRFEREARAAAALAHPNILRIFDVGTHEGLPFLVSELLEGVTLRERLASGPLPPARGWGKLDWIEHDPDYETLRGDPRFQALLAKLR